MAQLATNEPIHGFTQGDTLVLESFATVTESYVSGTGLILSNASASATLALPGNDRVSSANGNTTITAPIATISTPVTLSYSTITLGAGGYANSLTITSTGAVSNPARLMARSSTGRAPSPMPGRSAKPP